MSSPVVTGEMLRLSAYDPGEKEARPLLLAP